MEKWNVVPLCERQLRDINPWDIINNGDLRKCNVYKGGGGYDQFPNICKRRLDIDVDYQFVVQLKGCPLKCPYCYVTPEGVWGVHGRTVEYTSQQLVDCCIENGLRVFHLMGGAPALYMDKWYDIIDRLPKNVVFHSDMMLVESKYDMEVLKRINRQNCLYAVSIKGVSMNEFWHNTGTVFNWHLFQDNLDKVIKSGVNFYFTFTGVCASNIQRFKEIFSKYYGCEIFKDAFSIDIKHYKALD